MVVGKKLLKTLTWFYRINIKKMSIYVHLAQSKHHQKKYRLVWLGIIFAYMKISGGDGGVFSEFKTGGRGCKGESKLRRGILEGEKGLLE